MLAPLTIPALLAVAITSRSIADDTPQVPEESPLELVARTCLHCHLPGGTAPIVFSDGAALKRSARTAIKALELGNMPPWLPAQDPTGFLGVASVTAAERQELIEWFAAGSPGAEGWIAADHVPVPPATTGRMRFGEGWATPAEASLLFSRTFLIQSPPGFPQRFRGLRYSPDEPGALEMAMLNSDTTGLGRALDERDGAIGAAFHADLGTVPAGTLGAAGVDPLFELPAGFTFEVVPGADILAEAHARPLGRPGNGAFEVQLIPSTAADTTVVESYVVGAATSGAPGRVDGLSMNYRCDVIDAPMDILTILPNAGIRCVSFNLDLVRRDGTRQGVLNISAYRPWADRMYVLRDALRVQPGDRFELCVVHQDLYAFTHTHASAVMLTAPVPQPAVVVEVAPASSETADALPMVRIEPDLLLSATEVTFEQFRRILGRIPTPQDVHDTRHTSIRPEDAAPEPQPAPPPDVSLPCTHASWFDAIEFCNAASRTAGLPEHYSIESIERASDGAIVAAVVEVKSSAGYRLPNEAEWRSAAGAPALSGMCGSLWEWCADGFRERSHPSVAPQIPASGSNRGRVIAGGSFADPPASCMPETRSGLPASSREPFLGFRIARTAVSGPASAPKPAAK